MPTAKARPIDPTVVAGQSARPAEQDLDLTKTGTQTRRDVEEAERKAAVSPSATLPGTIPGTSTRDGASSQGLGAVVAAPTTATDLDPHDLGVTAARPDLHRREYQRGLVGGTMEAFRDRKPPSGPDGDYPEFNQVEGTIVEEDGVPIVAVPSTDPDNILGMQFYGILGGLGNYLDQHPDAPLSDNLERVVELVEEARELMPVVN